MAEEQEKKEKKPEKKPAAKGAKGGAGKAKKKGPLLSKLYSLAGERIQRLSKFCPKCGSGVFMGRHADRMVCGKCRYAELGRK